jgi:hypothetical protein
MLNCRVALECRTGLTLQLSDVDVLDVDPPALWPADVALAFGWRSGSPLRQSWHRTGGFSR